MESVKSAQFQALSRNEMALVNGGKFFGFVSARREMKLLINLYRFLLPVSKNINFETGFHFSLNKLYTIAIVIISINVNISYSQNNILTIKIIDNTNMQAVAYANVYTGDKKYGFISNEHGIIQLDLSEEVPDETLFVSCVGYKTDEIDLKNFKALAQDTIVVKLKKIDYELKEVTIIGNKSENYHIKKIGFTSKTKAGFGSFYAGYGLQVARYFPNKIKDQKVYLAAVSFFIKKDGFPRSKFRIRIYDVNSEGAPGNDLLVDNLIVSSAEKGNSWVSIDLTSQYIRVPQNGLFVAMEWLPLTKDSIYHVKTTNSIIKGNGQVLGAVSFPPDAPDYTWTKDNLHNWMQRKNVGNVEFANIINAAIAIKYKIYK